jgi:hypothetical protein
MMLQVYQRPVYGYAMDPSAFLAITAAAPRAAGSPTPAAACSTAPPTIVCVADADGSQRGGGGGNGALSSAGGSSCCVPVPVNDPLLDKPPVPPCSIFIPPSAVPPSGFPSGSPLPRYPSPVPNRAGSTGSPADSPRASAYLANPPSSMSSPSVGHGSSSLLYASPTARWQQQQTSLQEAYLQKMQQQQRELQELSSPRTAPSPSRFTDQHQQQQQQPAAPPPGGADAAEGAAAPPPGGLPPPAFASSKLAAVRTLAAVDQQRKDLG